MSKITVSLLIGDHFINEDNIQSLKREGSGTRIILLKGEDIVVPVSYDKVKAIVPTLSKTK